MANLELDVADVLFEDRLTTTLFTQTLRLSCIGRRLRYQTLYQICRGSGLCRRCSGLLSVAWLAAIAILFTLNYWLQGKRGLCLRLNACEEVEFIIVRTLKNMLIPTNLLFLLLALIVEHSDAATFAVMTIAILLTLL